jgi:hypothetical protein
MSCKKPSEYQKFLKQWKDANITSVTTAEVRKNWLKHASVAWNSTKKIKEAEKEKKAKENAAACKLRTASSPKVVGTPLRVNNANTASSLGLSPVSVPEKRVRSLQQCRIDLNTQAAILAKRNSSLCGKVCGMQQQYSPRLFSPSKPRLSMPSAPSVRLLESDEDAFVKRLMADGTREARARQLYKSLETKERRDRFRTGNVINDRVVRENINNDGLQLVPYSARPNASEIEFARDEALRKANRDEARLKQAAAKRDEALRKQTVDQIYFDDEDKTQFYKDFYISGKSRDEIDRLWQKQQKRLDKMSGEDDEMVTAFRMRNAPRRFRFF